MKEYFKGIVVDYSANRINDITMYWWNRHLKNVEAMVVAAFSGVYASADCGNPTGSPIFPEYQPEKFKVDGAYEAVWARPDPNSYFPVRESKPSPAVSRCNCNAPYTNDIHADWCPERA